MIDYDELASGSSLRRLSLRICRMIDKANRVAGAICAVLIVLMVLDTFLVAVLRYVFGVGWIWLQELYVWFFGSVFMMAAGYTYLHDEHVRVDVIYGGLSERKRAWINLFGFVVFLVPVLCVLAYYVYPYVVLSWARGEGARDAGGLPAIYILKSMMLVFITMLMLQGVSIALRNIQILSATRRGKSGASESGENNASE